MPADPKEVSPDLSVYDYAIGYCSGAELHAKFMESVLGLFQRGPRPSFTIPVIAGPDLMTARRDLVTGFVRETSASYLLMVDSDMVFDTSDVVDLFAVSQEVSGVVSGLYVQNSGRPAAWRETEEGYEWLRKPPAGLEEVAAVGAGFLLIPREVLEKVGPEVAFDYLEHKGEMHGEDFSFCKRVRDAGFSVWLAPVDVGHIKSRIIYPDGKVLIV